MNTMAQPAYGKALTTVIMMGFGGAVLVKDPMVFVDILSRLAQTVTGLAGSMGHDVTEGAMLVDKITERSLKTLSDKLERLERAGQRTVIIPSGGGGYGSSWMGTGLVLVCGVGGGWYFLYGGKFVTKEHLESAVQSLATGVSAVSGTVSQMKHTFTDLIGGVQTRQDEMMDAQDQMQENLDTVGESVEEVKESVYEVKDDLKKLNDSMSECRSFLERSYAEQALTAQGVRLLCGVVANSMQDQRLKKEIEQYVADMPGASPSRSLLESSGSETPPPRPNVISRSLSWSWAAPSTPPPNTQDSRRASMSLSRSKSMKPIYHGDDSSDEGEGYTHWMSGPKSRSKNVKKRGGNDSDSEVPPPPKW